MPKKQSFLRDFRYLGIKKKPKTNKQKTKILLGTIFIKAFRCLELVTQISDIWISGIVPQFPQCTMGIIIVFLS